MYLSTTVIIPEIKGKIITKKKGNATYVLYQYGSTYNKEKQYAVPKRSIIGKVSPDDTTQMFPNENYEVYFPDAETLQKLPVAKRSCCLRIGAYAVIRKTIEEYGLKGILLTYFGSNANLVLDLVAYLIIEEENAAQYYPDYAFNHPLFTEGMKIYSDSKISRFLSSVTRDQCSGFLDDWNYERNHKSRVYVSYDSTNKNSQAGEVELVEFGKAKDNKGFPVFNLSVAMDTTNKVPLFYEEYPGSVTDVSHLTFMVDKVKEYGYRDIGFILDRGYFSKDNISYMDVEGFAFIIMCKGCKALVSSLVEKVYGSFETKREASIRPYRVYGTTLPSFLYADDTYERYFHIYYSPKKQSAEREMLEQKIEKMRGFLESRIGKEEKFSSTYDNYFHLLYDKKGKLVGVEERAENIERELKLCGYFCIITSEKMSATEALTLYKSRDASEKLFRADKTFLGSSSERVHSSQSTSAKIFIEFIALIVRNRIYNLLKEQMLRMEARRNFMTVPAALRELEKIEMVRRGNGTYKLDHAVTKTQKIILSSFGLDETSITKIANEISRTLTLECLTNEIQEEEDGTEEINFDD